MPLNPGRRGKDGGFTVRHAGGIGLCLFMIFAAILAVAGARAGQRTSLEAIRASGPIPYFIAVGSEASGFRPGDEQLAVWALEAWRRSAGGAFQLAAAPEVDALVRLHWAGPLEGQYGEMRPLIVGGRRGASVFIRPDMNALGERIATLAHDDGLLRDSIVYLTCLHELGHAFGLEHTSDFRDIMYFFGYGGDIEEYFGRYRRQLRSRSDIASTEGLSAADVTRIKALYAH
jgi:hypothetical protein